MEVLTAWDHVQGSAVGKYWSELSGFLALKSSIFLRKAGQERLQLACSFDLQETQLLASDRQLLVLCAPVQLPHLSTVSVQSLAKWFQPWHLRHLVGSRLVFSI